MSFQQNRRTSTNSSFRGESWAEKVKQHVADGRQLAMEWWHYGIAVWIDLSWWQKALVVCGGATFWALAIVMLIYHDKILEMMVEFSRKWHDMPGGGVLMFLMIVLISFPPLIGYSALSSITGMMYGFPWGWPFLTLATVVGSTVSFLTFRYLLADYAKRLASRNTKFAALTSTMEQDTFKLLWMIRLCPLPYSLSNGALSSIHSISTKQFALATLITSPKLMIHIFIGDRMAKLGAEKDTASKIVDFISIALAAIAGTATAWVIYDRTMQHARALEQEQAAGTYNGFEGDTFDVDAREYELSSDEEFDEGERRV